VDFPARRQPFIIVGAFLALCLVASVAFGAATGNIGGLVAALIFFVALVPTWRRAFDKEPAMTIDSNGVTARAGGVIVLWDEVTGVRQHAVPTPGTGGRGFLILGLKEGVTPERTSIIGSRPKKGDNGPEIWIPLTGIEASPKEVLETAMQQRALAQS
jgi:hypothetical protein